MKEGHIKGLSQGLIPEPRVESYRVLRWFLFDSPGPLILGDIACLFEFKRGKRFRPINFNVDEIKNVYLPISNKKILIGTSLSSIMSVNNKLINEAIAKCSRELFISSDCSSDILSLIPMIGTESKIISREELEQMANQIIQNYKPN